MRTLGRVRGWLALIGIAILISGLAVYTLARNSPGIAPAIGAGLTGTGLTVVIVELVEVQTRAESEARARLLREPFAVNIRAAADLAVAIWWMLWMPIAGTSDPEYAQKMMGYKEIAFRKALALGLQESLVEDFLISKAPPDARLRTITTAVRDARGVAVVSAYLLGQMAAELISTTEPDRVLNEEELPKVADRLRMMGADEQVTRGALRFLGAYLGATNRREEWRGFFQALAYSLDGFLLREGKSACEEFVATAWKHMDAADFEQLAEKAMKSDEALRHLRVQD